MTCSIFRQNIKEDNRGEVVRTPWCVIGGVTVVVVAVIAVEYRDSRVRRKPSSRVGRVNLEDCSVYPYEAACARARLPARVCFYYATYMCACVCRESASVFALLCIEKRVHYGSCRGELFSTNTVGPASESTADVRALPASEILPVSSFQVLLSSSSSSPPPTSSPSSSSPPSSSPSTFVVNVVNVVIVIIIVAAVIVSCCDRRARYARRVTAVLASLSAAVNDPVHRDRGEPRPPRVARGGPRRERVRHAREG
ncbi:hypothetical protein PUN28_012981 [Cardiocondyla obscurior]|uniref:Uncharacterized protein n=1 Tax=Cardiocondyla obscurior TaxID=286306 RepID=A0AAW2F8T4_9HYME